MKEEDIKTDRIIRLIKASKNAGGELEIIMKDSLKNSNSEKEFEITWFYNLRNFSNQVIGFRNILAERNGYDCISTCNRKILIL